MSYPIADMVSGIKNGYLAHLGSVEMSYSAFKENIAQVLKREGFIADVKTKEKNGKKFLLLTLKYEGRNSQINSIKLISKPGLRRYIKAKEIKKILGGLGMQILSTPQGVLSSKEARKKGLGGEVICEVW